jgi:eukaryotic-like serine/threonine-protein kinase
VIEERVFNNRYRLDGKLGEGGMAIVYSGTDTVLRRRVAIKVLREQYAADEEFVRRFYQEAESAAKLSHPNIVNTYDVGREGATYYIVMELVDGPSLAEIIAADGKLPEPVAIDYAAQIASGLAYAHRAGLLHRDIKPANILVTKDDVVKLSDFGIARAVSQNTIAMTKPGLVMGSVYYMSPEQAQLNELHETSDLYSVGIVLFQMLTGKLPFSGESPVTVALRHISDPVPRIDTRELGVSPALAAIVNRLLQKRPENRFQSASELATSLREARERPNSPAFRLQDDAAELAMEEARRRQQRLPRRSTPQPDSSRRYAVDDDEEERPPRRTAMYVVLAVFLIAAFGAGYYLFGRPLPNLGATIPLADYTRMTDAQANAAIVNAGLRVKIDKSPSDSVPANRVVSQDPAPGTNVEKNSLVSLVISSGMPTLAVPSMLGYPWVEAERTLQSWPNAKFTVDVKRRFDQGPKDSVIDQLPKPGSQVREGSKITLTVSDGIAPVEVPNFVGMATAAAQALAAKAGIKLDTSQTILGMPANTIASQDPAPGTKGDATTIVHAIVNSGGNGVAPTGAAGANATVPSIVGDDYATAAAALSGAGFVPSLRYAQQTTNNGTVVLQDPAGNASVPQGSTVNVTLSVSGEVPDTVGMLPDAATRKLAAFGYGIAKIEYTTSVGAGGKVVGTVPEAGTDLAPSSSVTLIVNGPGH